MLSVANVFRTLRGKQSNRSDVGGTILLMLLVCLLRSLLKSVEEELHQR